MSALLLVATMVAPGCGKTGHGTGPADRGASNRTTTTVDPSGVRWKTPLPVVGQAVAAGDVAVAYTSEKESLSLVGIDPSNGRKLWTREATPSFAPPGIPLTPTVVGDPGHRVVAYYRPVKLDSLLARLVVADASTGDEIASSDPLPFLEPPDACDDGHDVCARFVQHDETEARVRVDVSTGKVGDEPQPPADSQRSIGKDGLIDLRVDGVQYLARVDGDRVLWRTPVSVAFGAGWTTDGGWGWVHFVDQGLFVGIIGRDPKTEPATIDLSDEKIVALDDRTGQVRWATDGAGTSCLASLALPATADPERDAIPLRCRMRGTVTRSDGDVTDFNATLERFDVATGTISWSVDLGDVEELFGGSGIGGVGGVVDTHTIVVPRSGTTVVLDLDDGSTRAVRPDEHVGCPSQVVQFTFAVAYPLPTRKTKKRLGGVLAHGCDGHLHQTSKPLTPAVARAMGTTIGGDVVVAEKGYLVGYDAG
ncbi:MAG: hypothetical protein JO291_02185 [Acidimicrobiia bacterium]|nr:hypothetical protein [Acidimicrobiia bacterium]